MRFSQDIRTDSANINLIELITLNEERQIHDNVEIMKENWFQK